MTLIARALELGTEGFHQRRRGEESLEEDLFAHIAAGLRELEPYHHFLGEVIETAMSPFSRSAVAQLGEEVRLRHLEMVAELLVEHALGEAQSFVSVHLYWTLYLGVLAFWSKDESPNQEDTLVVLDQSLRLYVASVGKEGSDGSEGS